MRVKVTASQRWDVFWDTVYCDQQNLAENCSPARDVNGRDETETLTIRRDETKMRHWCVSRPSRDRDVETETTTLYTRALQPMATCRQPPYLRPVPLYPVYTIQPLFVQPVVKPGCTTGLTTCCIHETAGWLSNRLSNGFNNRLNVCIRYTIQPVVKPVW